jgi:ribosomal-protein-alanine N-acetyltransferase
MTIEPKEVVNIRWLVPADLPQVLAIEETSFEFPWSDEEFRRCLRQQNCIGLVAESNHRVLGYVFYEIDRTQFHVLNLAVHPEYRRRGVGKTLVQKLIGKLAPGGRTRIQLEVRETNLAAQLFFRSMGFRATAILRNFYEDTVEDAYLMQYVYPGQQDVEAADAARRWRMAG